LSSSGVLLLGIKTVLHPVSDLETAKALYAALLGVPPQTGRVLYVSRGPARILGRGGWAAHDQADGVEARRGSTVRPITRSPK
jgi:hypothetical protein